MTYQLVPLDPATADRYRTPGAEVVIADADPGYPCRQCLCDARVGDEMLLVSHDPFDGPTPYRSATAIFIHRQPCELPTSVTEVAEQQTRRQLSVRAFDRRQRMVGAHVIPGPALHETLVDLFSDEFVDRIDVHNAPQGCWAVSARRA